MRHAPWRWLFGLGAPIAAGAMLLGQGGAADASRAAVSQAAAPSRAAAHPAFSRGAAGGFARSRAAAASAAAWIPPGGILALGMHGAAVRRLQARLAALKYYPGRIDGRFGLDTLEAVWAFKEVQGLIIDSANSDEVSRATERALAHPRAPRVLVRGGGSRRIEVNTGDEVLVLYNHGRVELISHVSTGADCLPGEGCSWDTPTGDFSALSFHRGWITVPLGEMYNPVFFIGMQYAIHGEWNTNVPWYPDSHGCVRIPYDTATFFHSLFGVPGTPIYIRD